MKFQSKFGLGEICVYDPTGRRSEKVNDLLVKVVQVVFEVGGTVGYTVEFKASNGTIQRILVHESSLEGDPEFNQEVGMYAGDIEKDD